MLDTKGHEASRIAGVWWLMFGLAAAVYAVVAGFVLRAVVRGRRREPDRPSALTDNHWIAIGGVVAPVLILVVVAVATVDTTAALRKPERGALVIDVHGKDWWWAVRYPGTGIVTANEIHIPIRRPIEIRLTSDNVIHSFWVPQIGGKVDVIPGQPNVFRFRVDTAGSYRGQCAEFCGIQHANMAFRLIADTPGLYERWVAAHRHPPSEPASELAALGQVAFQRLPCAGCHTVRGTQAHGHVGPDLTDLGARRTLGAGAIENTPAHLARWIRDAPSIKPGIAMPPLDISDTDARALVAYLESLR